MHQEDHNSKQWKECLNYIFRRVKEQSYNTWLRPTRGRPNGGDEFLITVPNQFVADWIGDHFTDTIQDAFMSVLGQQYCIKFVIDSQPVKSSQTSIDLQPSTPSPAPLESKSRYLQNLGSKYKFESLVIGDFNQFASAAAMAVAEGPGLTSYNPLFLYGGTGLGKTHIIQAIGHYILKESPSKRVMYATSEKFTSDFINSIANRSIANFTRIYRDVDVLMIDDIQFLSGKEQTQEQFFHTFNTLYHLGKQIVLSADRSPRDIKGLEDRLLSRFSSGLVADLQQPDLDNRTAILYKKLESEGTVLADDVVRYIADSVQTNIRELEGALIRLLAFSSLKSCPIDVTMAKEVLENTFSRRKRTVTISNIQSKTAEFLDVDEAMMKVKKKTANIVQARQVAMYLSRSLTDNSLKVIGTAFGGRDHSTVIHACNLVSNRIAEDADFREKIDRISAALLY